MKHIFISVFFLIQTLQATLTIEENQYYHDNFTIAYLDDPNEVLTFNDILEHNFTTTINNAIALGYKEGVVWLKLEMLNHSKIEDFILTFSEAFHENFRLYSFKDAEWVFDEGGLSQDISKRMVYDAMPTFRLHLTPHKKTTYYIKLKSRFAYAGKISLYTYEYFFSNQKAVMMSLYAFYFGTLCFVFALNLFLYMRLKEPIYASYASFVISIGFYNALLSGFTLYLGLGYLHYVLHSSASITLMTITLFSIHFLEVKKYSLWLERFLKFSVSLFAFLTILIILDLEPWYMIMNILATFLFIVLVSSGLYLSFKGHKNALLYFIIILPTVITTGFLAEMYNGNLPYTNFNRYSFLYASFFEITAFAFILSDRFFETKEIAQKDGLTTLYNRYYFNEISLSYFYNALRNKHNLTVIMLDIDDFKMVNDTYGHDVGDKVIVNVARNLKRLSRRNDIIVRFGGEEFLILLYNTPIESSITLAERLCTHVAKSPISTDKKKIYVTLSIGVSQLNHCNDAKIEDVIKRADQALYLSKKLGKDRVNYL